MNDQDVTHWYFRGWEVVDLTIRGLATNYYVDSYGRQWTHDPHFCGGCR